MSKIELGDVASQRVLGMRWNVQSDDFQFVINLPSKPPTRRNLLSITNAVFDPLAFYPLSYLKQGCCLESCVMVRLNGINLYSQPMPCIGKDRKRVCAV